ncbi:uncharacterized protein [Ovis canadensis]|uniref:uncharacterized protein n=1 Tax=Ovis canadensis TaxID=37174 RepID=UPI003750BC65
MPANLENSAVATGLEKFWRLESPASRLTANLVSGANFLPGLQMVGHLLALSSHDGEMGMRESFFILGHLECVSLPVPSVTGGEKTLLLKHSYDEGSYLQCDPGLKPRKASTQLRICQTLGNGLWIPERHEVLNCKSSESASQYPACLTERKGRGGLQIRRDSTSPENMNKRKNTQNLGSLGKEGLVMFIVQLAMLLLIVFYF